MSEQHIRGFHRLLISRTALEQKHGIHLAETFRKAGLKVYEFQDDVEVIKQPAALQLSTLVVVSTPSSGWMSRAEHGILATRVGEHYIHPIIGCRFGCSYCYLQVLPSGRLPLRLHVNFGDLVQTLNKYLREAKPDLELLFCTGELADSLAEVDLYPVAPALVENFAYRKGARLELRTKSDRVIPLLDLNHRHRTTVAFSVAPELHVSKYEPGTASLVKRLQAARLCQDAGYPVALKFEPLILTPNWKQLYEEALYLITSLLDTEAIEHVSVGCLRWSEALGALPVFTKHYSSMLKSSTRIQYRPRKFNGTMTWHQRLEAYQWMRSRLRQNGIIASIWWSLEEPQMIEVLESQDDSY